jgi:hypothetical protein
MNALLDIFVSYMTWFILDKEENPMFFKNEATGVVYQALNVIKETEETEAHSSTSSINSENSCES